MVKIRYHTLDATVNSGRWTCIDGVFEAVLNTLARGAPVSSSDPFPDLAHANCILGFLKAGEIVEKVPPTLDPQASH